MKRLFSIMSNLQTHYHLKRDFQKVDQHTGGKGLIHGTKHAWHSAVEYPSRESKHDNPNFHDMDTQPCLRDNDGPLPL